MGSSDHSEPFHGRLGLRLGLGLGLGCLSNLLDELDHADAVSLVENDGAAEAVELSGEPERSEAFGVVVKAPPGGVAEGLPGALGWVQGVQSNAGEGKGSAALHRCSLKLDPAWLKTKHLRPSRCPQTI